MIFDKLDKNIFSILGLAGILIYLYFGGRQFLENRGWIRPVIKTYSFEFRADSIQIITKDSSYTIPADSAIIFKTKKIRWL